MPVATPGNTAITLSNDGVELPKTRHPFLQIEQCVQYGKVACLKLPWQAALNSLAAFLDQLFFNPKVRDRFNNCPVRYLTGYDTKIASRNDRRRWNIYERHSRARPLFSRSRPIANAWPKGADAPRSWRRYHATWPAAARYGQGTKRETFRSSWDSLVRKTPKTLNGRAKFDAAALSTTRTRGAKVLQHHRVRQTT